MIMRFDGSRVANNSYYKRFVHVDTTSFRINNFHDKNSFINRIRRERSAEHPDWGPAACCSRHRTPSAAGARTWIQAYDVMKYVDPSGISYNAEEVEQEIRALYEGGLDGGYITWLSNSNLEKYKAQKKAYQIDYLKEYQQ